MNRKQISNPTLSFESYDFSTGGENRASRSTGDISKVLESRRLRGKGNRALQVKAKDSAFSSLTVTQKRYRSKTFSISPLALRENRFLDSLRVAREIFTGD